MQQSYKVFIEGKLVLITDTSSPKVAIREGYRVIHTPQKEQLKVLLSQLRKDEIEGAVLIARDTKKVLEDLKSFFTIAKACGGLVQNPNKEYLFIKRNGKWDLPKGRMDPGEKKKQTAVREVEEECAIRNINIGDRIVTTYHTYKRKGAYYFKPSYWYYMSIPNFQKGVPQEDEGITEIIWAKKEQIEGLLSNLYPTIRQVMHVALNDPM